MESQYINKVVFLDLSVRWGIRKLKTLVRVEPNFVISLYGFAACRRHLTLKRKWSNVPKCLLQWSRYHTNILRRNKIPGVNLSFLSEVSCLTILSLNYPNFDKQMYSPPLLAKQPEIINRYYSNQLRAELFVSTASRQFQWPWVGQKEAQ